MCALLRPEGDPILSLCATLKVKQVAIDIWKRAPAPRGHHSAQPDMAPAPHADVVTTLHSQTQGQGLLHHMQTWSPLCTARHKDKGSCTTCRRGHHSAQPDTRTRTPAPHADVVTTLHSQTQGQDSCTTCRRDHHSAQPDTR